MRTGIERISKTEWYRLGGFKNPALFRKAASNGAWRYYRDITR